MKINSNYHLGPGEWRGPVVLDNHNIISCASISMSIPFLIILPFHRLVLPQKKWLHFAQLQRLLGLEGEIENLD